MQSRVVYGNVYGNCSNVRRRQVASALTFGALRPTCVSASARRSILPGADRGIRWASLSSAAVAVKSAHQTAPYEQSLEEANKLKPNAKLSSDHRHSTPEAQSVSPTQQPTTGVDPGATKNEVPDSTNDQPVSLDTEKCDKSLKHTSARRARLQLSSRKQVQQTNGRPPTNRQLKRQRPAPGQIISAWQSGTLNFLSGEDVEAWSNSDALTSIFLRYIMFLGAPDISQLSRAGPDLQEGLLRPSEVFFTDSITASLQRHGCTPQDVQGWAWIALAPNAEVAAQRYLSSSVTYPPVILLTNVLRMKKMHIKTLRKLVFRVATWLTKISNSPASKNRSILEDNSFQTVVCGLLRHARATDPLSFTGIARLVGQYCDIVTSISDDARGFGGKKYIRLTNICRTVICRLSIPAAKTPYASMAYAWEAQQVILEAGNSLSPALELDARSYRAIACVLLADKKTEAESEAVAHLHRSWPPWKKVLDGMDARRLPEDDASRATRVLESMKASGYPPMPFESALSILAGRDTDGTPTIPTRTIMHLAWDKDLEDAGHNKPLQTPQKPSPNLASEEPSKPTEEGPSKATLAGPLKPFDERNPIKGNSSAGKSAAEWAARIRATRDVQEAWAAFRAYQGLPSQAMFYEMFLKLIYENVRQFRVRMQQPTVGDGLEMVPVENDNLSDFEIQRKSPPDVRGLYDLMRAAQLSASERTIRHLIEQADSFSWALRILLDSKLPSEAVSALMRGGGHGQEFEDRFSNEVKQTEPALARVPPKIFTAYIKLLARFSLAIPKHNYPPPTTHLDTALDLLKKHPSPPDSAWHTFLRAAAAPKTLPLPTMTQQESLDAPPLRQYDHAAAPHWNAIVFQSIAYLQQTGVEINPELFQHAAYAAYSNFFASRRRRIRDAHDMTERSLPVLRDLWLGISEPSEDVGGVGGELVHQVFGAHILSYIRVLAIADADEEIENVLEWMVRYQEALSVMGRTRGNGITSLRRVLVALRAYAERRDGEQESAYDGDWEGDAEDGEDGGGEREEGEMTQRLSELAEEIEEQWGGWPERWEVEEYFRDGRERYEDFGEGEWVVGGLVA